MKGITVIEPKWLAGIAKGISRAHPFKLSADAKQIRACASWANHYRHLSRTMIPMPMTSAATSFQSTETKAGTSHPIKYDFLRMSATLQPKLVWFADIVPTEATPAASPYIFTSSP